MPPKGFIVDALLVRHSLVLNMSRNPLIRRMINDIEDLIKSESLGGFAQPQLIPVPDELDAEIPRVVFTSQAGHTQVVVSQVSVTFNANYSPDWQGDPDKCRDYLLSKVDLLFKIAAAGWRHAKSPHFGGVTTVFRIPAANRAESVALLAPVFRDMQTLSKSANELSCRWSLDESEQFFNNIALQTFIALDDQLLSATDGIPRINDSTITACGVEIIGDYNDRLAFNGREHYSTNAETVKGMLSSGFEAAKNAVETIRQG